MQWSNFLSAAQVPPTIFTPVLRLRDWEAGVVVTHTDASWFLVLVNLSLNLMLQGTRAGSAGDAGDSRQSRVSKQHVNPLMAMPLCA
jgi:hypothetical protein